MLAFIDTETTGLPDYGRSFDDPCQPHIVQLAIIVTDNSGQNVKTRYNTLVKPREDAAWSAEAEKVHGISREDAMQRGQPGWKVADDLLRLTGSATIVAHNARFDTTLCAALLFRAAITTQRMWEWLRQPTVCTMRQAAPIMQLPIKGDQKPGEVIYRLPSLKEAHRFFTGEDFEGAHDALADAEACRRVWLGIQQHRQGKCA